MHLNLLVNSNMLIKDLKKIIIERICEDSILRDSIKLENISPEGIYGFIPSL